MSGVDLQDLPQEQVEAHNKRKRNLGRELASERDDVRKVMRTAEGRRLMFRLLDLTGLDADPFRGEQTNSTAYLCGRAGAGRDQRAMLMRWATDDYLLMLKETKPKEPDNDD